MHRRAIDGKIPVGRDYGTGGGKACMAPDDN